MGGHPTTRYFGDRTCLSKWHECREWAACSPDNLLSLRSREARQRLKFAGISGICEYATPTKVWRPPCTTRDTRRRETMTAHDRVYFRFAREHYVGRPLRDPEHVEALLEAAEI